MNRPAVDTSRARHSIAVVARQTGLSQLVLRAWERRYGAVTPARTPTGRRLYTDADIKRLRLLHTLTEAGHRIGDVADMPARELEELAAAADAAPAPAPRPGAEEAAPDRLLGEALQAVADLDAAALVRVLRQSAVALSRPRLRQELLVPLLLEVGERWRTGALRISHEHLATAVVRSFLNGLRDARPAEEIAAAALARDAVGVLLSLVYPAGDPALGEQLRALRRALGPGAALLVGGAAAASYADVLAEVGAVLVADGEALDRQLRTLS